MNIPITVMIPIGQQAHHIKWLQQGIDSIAKQSMPPDELLLVFDGGMMGGRDTRIDKFRYPAHIKRSFYTIPWRSGVANAFNTGVAVARNDLVIMMGSDDMLMPDAVRNAWAAWRHWHDKHGYYYFGVQYSDGREQNVPCNAAMVHRELWMLNGGFPIESSIGACDTMLISCMIAANGRLGNLYSIHDVSQVCDYWYRAHGDTETIHRGEWFEVITQVRNLLTQKVKQ